MTAVAIAAFPPTLVDSFCQPLWVTVTRVIRSLRSRDAALLPMSSWPWRDPALSAPV